VYSSVQAIFKIAHTARVDTRTQQYDDDEMRVIPIPFTLFLLQYLVPLYISSLSLSS
jgi:hypothetical protein